MFNSAACKTIQHLPLWHSTLENLISRNNKVRQVREISIKRVWQESL